MEVKQHAQSAQVPRSRSTPKNVPQTCPDLANTTASPRPFVRLFGLFVDFPLGTCESVDGRSKAHRRQESPFSMSNRTISRENAAAPPLDDTRGENARIRLISSALSPRFHHLAPRLVAPLDHTPHHVHNIISTLVIYLQICRRIGCVIPCCKL